MDSLEYQKNLDSIVLFLKTFVWKKENKNSMMSVKVMEVILQILLHSTA